MLITDIMRRTDRLKFLRVTVFFLVYSIIHIVCDPSEKVKLNEEPSTTFATDTLEDEGTIPSPTGSNLPIKVSLFLISYRYQSRNRIFMFLVCVGQF